MATEQKLSKAMDNEKPQVHIDAIRTGKDRLVDEREGWQSTKRARLGEGPCCFLVASSGILLMFGSTHGPSASPMLSQCLTRAEQHFYDIKS